MRNKMETETPGRKRNRRVQPIDQAVWFDYRLTYYQENLIYGSEMKELRTKSGVTQVEVADVMGVSAGTIGALENGTRTWDGDRESAYRLAIRTLTTVRRELRLVSGRK